MWLNCRNQQTCYFLNQSKKNASIWNILDFLRQPLARKQKNWFKSYSMAQLISRFLFVHFHWAYGFCSTFLVHITHVFNWRFCFCHLPRSSYNKMPIFVIQFCRRFEKCFPFHSRAFVCNELRNENWKFLRGFDCLHVFTPNCPFA